MLYTVMPLEEVLDGIDDPPPKLVDVAMGGVLLQVEPLSDFSYRIERVISSDPQVYLDIQYQPGAIKRWT